MQYNPQVDIEITRLAADGSEQQITDNFTSIADQDFNFHSTNKPLDFKASINKRLGSEQDTCTVTIQNPQFLEDLRQNPTSFVENIRDNFYRIRVWAWHDDNNQVSNTVRPNIPPVWVGDILDGFSSGSTSTTDSQLTIESSSHSWLATSGKMRRTWAMGTTYDVIMNDILDWFLNERGYGKETIGGTAKKVITGVENGLLASKATKKAFTINRNPIEVANDLCREFDLMFGFHCNIPYVLARSNYFLVNELNDISVGNEGVLIDRQTGKIGISDFSSYSINCSSIFNQYHIIGSLATISDAPQIDGGLALGRIDSTQITLANGSDGHVSGISCSYVGSDGNIVLPRRRNNSSGSVLL